MSTVWSVTVAEPSMQSTSVDVPPLFVYLDTYTDAYTPGYPPG